MSDNKIKKMIADTFLEVADALETGEYGKKPIIGIAAEGSELGENNVIDAISYAEKKGYKALEIKGDDVHKKMEQLLESGEIDGAVTMHYPFPIGVSTVGKVITPAEGKIMYLATTTGTSDANNVCSMIKNAIIGIIAAKADGISSPTVGIANINGARQCEKALIKLKENGYNINFSESARADGGIVMRGNDLLKASADVMVMDSLTGNLMTKIFSSYTTGGGYESLGWGYGPGIGEGFDKCILIISRASGAPVIANAVEYASTILSNNISQIRKKEFDDANKAGLKEILSEITEVKGISEDKKVEMPNKEVVDEEIPGIEVMDIEDAVKSLWSEKIYAESGMGCTGPVILVNSEKCESALKVLNENGYV